MLKHTEATPSLPAGISLFTLKTCGNRVEVSDLFSLHPQSHAHLTPGPGIYFNAFIHVYSPKAGADNPLGTNVDVNRKPISLCQFVASFKIISFEVWFYTFFMFFHMYIAPGRGWQQTGDKILMTTARPFLFVQMLQVSKWSLQNLTLYTFLMILYIYIAPGQGQKTPWGQTFDVNRKPLSLRSFVANFNKSLWILILYTFLNPNLPSGPVHPYQLEESISNFRGVWCTYFISNRYSC